MTAIRRNWKKGIFSRRVETQRPTYHKTLSYQYEYYPLKSKVPSVQEMKQQAEQQAEQEARNKRIERIFVAYCALALAVAAVGGTLALKKALSKPHKCLFQKTHNINGETNTIISLKNSQM